MGVMERIASAIIGPPVLEPPTRQQLARSQERSATGSVKPPSRAAAPTYVSSDTALTLSDVYRGIQILATSGSQLSMDEYRGDNPVERPHPLVRQHSLDLDPSHFYEENIVALATCGNAYWRHIFGMDGKTVIDIELMNPAEVVVEQKRSQGIARDTIVYHYRGVTLQAKDVTHLKLMRRTGYPLGLGPIQAAQVELGGAVDARNYSAQWFSTTDVPNGYLKSDQNLNPAEAGNYLRMWTGDGEELKGHRMRVLGAGLEYKPLLLKPADVQFLETRQFNRTGIATLLGIPASLLNAPVQGNSKTYQNAEDEYIIFNRFTLMLYLRPIEVALSGLIPNGSKARFNIEALLRTATKDRYESYKTGIDAGFLTVPEVRRREGLPPLAITQEATNVSA